ncbi:MAG TPA: arginine repressor [Candidatus Tetragenococcus pullicola]|nr:arginine repressor [Candidatus Tetragenococcus pullicola]
MNKKERHRLITKFLTQENIQKQEELVKRLHEEGVPVTQATVSRDIKELKLIKIPSDNGGYRYSLPLESENVSEKLKKLVQDAFISIDQMDKFVLLRTLPGNASAIANLIDKKYHSQLFGLLNDDDNILMIVKTDKDREKVYQELHQLID